MFQMDWSRRGLLGQRAAVAGRRFIVADFRARALALDGTTRALYGQLDPVEREACDAYAAGVTRWLATHTLPREFRRLGYHPTPWRSEDCLVIWRGMALTLTDLAEDLTGPETGEVRDPDAGTEPLLGELATQPFAVSGIGSNGWAASGTRTRTGRALLAGDPHLALACPVPLHRCMLSAPGVAFTGFDLPGVRNGDRPLRSIAWTVTAFEEMNPTSSATRWTRGRPPATAYPPVGGASRRQDRSSGCASGAAGHTVFWQRWS